MYPSCLSIFTLFTSTVHVTQQNGLSHYVQIKCPVFTIKKWDVLNGLWYNNGVGQCLAETLQGCHADQMLGKCVPCSYGTWENEYCIAIVLVSGMWLKVPGLMLWPLVIKPIRMRYGAGWISTRPFIILKSRMVLMWALLFLFIPAEVRHHAGDATSLSIVVGDKPCPSSLNSLQGVDVSLSGGVPDCSSVLKCWAAKGGNCPFFCCLRASVDVPPQES